MRIESVENVLLYEILTRENSSWLDCFVVRLWRICTETKEFQENFSWVEWPKFKCSSAKRESLMVENWQFRIGGFSLPVTFYACLSLSLSFSLSVSPSLPHHPPLSLSLSPLSLSLSFPPSLRPLSLSLSLSLSRSLYPRRMCHSSTSPTDKHTQILEYLCWNLIGIIWTGNIIFLSLSIVICQHELKKKKKKKKKKKLKRATSMYIAKLTAGSTHRKAYTLNIL